MEDTVFCCHKGFYRSDLEKIDWSLYDASFSYEKDENNATSMEFGQMGFHQRDVYHMFVKTTNPEKVKTLLESMKPGYVSYKLPKDECVLTQYLDDQEMKEVIQELSKKELGIGMNIRVEDNTLKIHFKRQHKEAFINKYRLPPVYKDGRVIDITYGEQHYLEVPEPVTNEVKVYFS